MNVHFSDDGWDDYRHWAEADLDMLARVNVLIEDIRRNPFTGRGKPEPLRGDLAKWWSRRITGNHRLIYRVEGVPGVDQRVRIMACRYHYERG